MNLEIHFRKFENIAGKVQHEKWNMKKWKNVTWKSGNMKKYSLKRPKDRNMIWVQYWRLPLKSVLWKECNMRKVLQGKGATWNGCDMVQCEKSAMWIVRSVRKSSSKNGYHGKHNKGPNWKSATWKNCNMKRVLQENIYKRKKVQHEKSPT